MRHSLISVLTLCIAVSTPSADGNPGLSPEDDTRADFDIALHGLVSDLRVITTSVMPGRSLTVDTPVSANASGGQLTRSQDGWVWRAPAEPGLYRLEFSDGEDEIRLNVFVLTPYENGVQSSLDGFRIGRYSETRHRDLASYAVPGGFIGLGPEDRDLEVSPNFTLGQFLCKQQPGHDPAYLLIRPALLLKLEALLQAANEKGWPADTLFVMSGFRTPYYNAAIGNRTTASRHLYGDAADIYIDHDRDGKMDDLTGDGIVDRNDASALATLAESLGDGDATDWIAGGLAVYGANAVHGPFVHIDARGAVARW